MRRNRDLQRSHPWDEITMAGGLVEIAMMAAMRREGGYEAEIEREMLLSVDAHKCARPKEPKSNQHSTMHKRYVCVPKPRLRNFNGL